MSSASGGGVIPEPGSYRDRDGAIYYCGGRVFRGLSDAAAANWRRLENSRFFQRCSRDGAIIGTHTADAQVLESAGAGWAAVVEHDRIPFISYPYEWTFGMLKDAALLHLRLMQEALADGMILKDSSAYNIQWRGTRPVFIDTPSIEPLGKGETWVGYRQFCELFLYPLMLQAYKGLDYRPWLRGRIDGISADEMRAALSGRDMMRAGVLLHVMAQSALQRRYADSGRNVRGTLVEAGFDKKLIERNVGKLTKLISRLQPARTKTEWSDYDRTHSYDADEFEAKQDFVRRVASHRRWGLVWDLGCNTGIFSRIVEDHADHVVAMDGDWMAIEHFYQRTKAQGGNDKILPLVVNLADASPNQGWLGLERKALPERGRPDLTLCLALVHHIVISANIPLAQFIEWLASLGTAVVIEFVGRDDEMVRKLLANRKDQYDDYHPDRFRQILAGYFRIEEEKDLKGGKRTIFFAVPKV